MKRLGPFHTLAAGAIFTLALGVVSAQAGPTTTDADPAAADTAITSTDEPTAEPTAEPSASAEPAPEKKADTTPKKADYAGVVQGNGGLIALSIRDGKAIAYFCDGKNESWLKGKAENNTLTLEGKKSLLTAALGNGKAQGRLEVRGSKWRFVAPLVKKPSGLYRATAFVRGARISGTWIKLANGQQVGTVTLGGNAEAAPVLGPDGSATVYGQTLTSQDVDTFFAKQAS